MSEPVLKVNNISKNFGKKEIIKNISFEVNKGDIVAFIGPNGSGKTTTIKCILGLYNLTKGSVTIDGYDSKKDFENYIKKVGNIVESPDFYLELTGYNNLKIMANLYENITDEDINKCIKLVGLENRINEKVKTYSLGMKQRLGIALALINDPDLLILDEPTNGLDPTGIIELRELFKTLASNGKSLLISSHNLNELNQFCNKVILIKKGIIIDDYALTNQDSKRYILKLDNTKNLDKVLKEDYEIIDDNHIIINTTENEIAKINKKLITNKYLVYMLKEYNISLEEEYIKKVGDNNV